MAEALIQIDADLSRAKAAYDAFMAEVASRSPYAQINTPGAPVSGGGMAATYQRLEKFRDTYDRTPGPGARRREAQEGVEKESQRIANSLAKEAAAAERAAAAAHKRADAEARMVAGLQTQARLAAASPADRLRILGDRLLDAKSPAETARADLALTREQQRQQQATERAAAAEERKRKKEEGEDGRGGGPSLIDRLVRIFTVNLAANTVSRLGRGYVDYLGELAQATNPIDSYKAERGLQEKIYSTPYIGGLLAVAASPYTMQTEAVIRQAEEGGRYSDLTERSIDSRRQSDYEAAAARAGVGSDRSAQIGIESQYKEKEAQVTKELQALAEQAARVRESLQPMNFFEPVDLPLLGTVDPFGGKYQREQDAAQRADVVNAQRLQREREERLANAAVVRDAQLKELDYQRQRSQLAAENARDYAKLEYERKPEVAQARELYDRGLAQAEAAQHAGRTPEARADLEATKYRLQKFAEDLQESGSATEQENTSLDFSGTDRPGKRIDDTSEAYGKALELLGQISTKLDELKNL